MTGRVCLLSIILFLLSGCFLQPEPDPVQKDPPNVRVLLYGTFPSVSPDGTMLAFSNNGAIFISDTGGRGMKKLTDGSDHDISPQWSPLGGSVGFIRKRRIYEENGTLMMVDTGTTNVRQISEYGSVYCLSEFGSASYSRASAPIWSFSPDGSLAAYYYGNDSSTYLRIDRTDGSNAVVRVFPLYVERPTDLFGNIAGFRWLPGSRQLICTANPESDSSYLYRVDITGFTMTKVSGRRSVVFPSVTADGRYAGCYSLSNNRYIVTDLITGKDTTIVTGNSSPKLSPDGVTIVWYTYSYSSNPDGYSASILQSVNRNTMAVSTVALSNNNPHFVFHPSSRSVFLSYNGLLKKAPLP